MNRQERRRAAKDPNAGGTARVAVAVARYRAGDAAGAEVLLRAVLVQEPEQPEALRALGEILTHRGQIADAIGLLQRLVALRARDFEAHYTLGNAYRLTGRIDLAMPSLQTSLALNPGFAGALHGLGACCLVAERESEALEYFRQAVRAKPDWALAWKDLGTTLAMLGEMGMAEEALRRATVMQPALGDAQRHLAAIRQDQAIADEMTALEQRSADPMLPAAEKTEMLFALGNMEDKAGRYDAAFAHVAKANAMLRARQIAAGKGFDRARLSRDVDLLIDAFPPGSLHAFAAFGDPSELPVFIVGMPRAGSTLFEQIAASHSQVYGAGEMSGIGRLAAGLGQRPTDRWAEASLAKAASAFLRDMGDRGGGARRVIDKMPDNIFMLGLIAALFPNARVVFCERDPRDVAISCFFQSFSQPMAFDTNLADCAFRGREIARLTDHWRSVLALRMLTLSYEKLLADLEGESRRLIEFLGLDWEPGCLNFHQTIRPVRTASWAQVRQPLYQSSAGRWHNYVKYLEGQAF